MRLQNAAEKGLCFGCQIICAFKPQNGRFGAAGPNVELLATIAKGTIFSAGADKKLLVNLFGVFLNPVAFSTSRRAG
jgi:hypothetical protein